MGNGFSRVVWYYHTCSFFLASFPLFFFLPFHAEGRVYIHVSRRAWEMVGPQTHSAILD